MGAIQSLWDQDPCYWDQLPDELQQKIYREAVNNMSPSEMIAHSPGGYIHWLRTSPIGPELERHVRREAYIDGIPEQGTSLMLKDIVKVITRFERDNPLKLPLRPAALPVEVESHGVLYTAPSRLLRQRLRVRFVILLGAESEMSPWLYGKEVTAAELGWVGPTRRFTR